MASIISTLNAGGKRARTHNAQLVIKLPGAAKSLVKAEADRQGVSEATVVRQALADYFERRGLGK